MRIDRAAPLSATHRVHCALRG